MEYYFKLSALKDLKKLPKDKQIFIIKKLDFYTSQSNPLKFAKKMIDKAFGQYRFRIGDYRVIFDVVNNKIIILRLGHRKNIYK
jgi:mRNA interferase RelE/StbE